MKNQSIIAISILAVAVGLALGYALWGSGSGQHSMNKHTATKDTPAGIHRMPDGSLMGNATTENGMGMMDDKDHRMMNGMDHSMMMVKSERAFLEGMIPHHQEAVDTAKEVLARGGSTPEIKALAEAIVVAQEKEIAMMKVWYQNWYDVAYVPNPTAYEPMMRDLSTLSGAALDAVFLEDMIVHHQGAIMMVESVKPYIEHTEIADLSDAIIDSQTAEIKQMEALLENL